MTLKGDVPTVLLPVETVRRELDSKLALASALARHGIRTIVGHKEAANAIGLASRRVVWQGKDCFSEHSSDHVASRLIERESAVMFFQEEGGIFPEHSWERLVLFKHRADHIRERPLTRLCAWGQRQQALLEGYGLVPHTPIAVTGSPRFDLCRPEYRWLSWQDVAAAAAAHRPYILMCTRFTSVAHQQGIGRFFRLAAAEPEPDETADRFATWHRDAHDLADFVMLVKEVSSTYADRTIVLRPHPSESLMFYKDTFAPFRNVSVVSDGSVVDWIHAADLVVHCNCTTGVEAVFAGRPVVNMQPTAVSRAGFDKEVAREAGVSASSLPDAIEKIERALQSDPAPQVWSDRARSMLQNLTADALPLLVQETLAVVTAKGVAASDVVLPKERALRKWVRGWLRSDANAYVAGKRGALDASHVERVIDGCRSHVGGAGRIRHMTPEYVVVEPS